MRGIIFVGVRVDTHALLALEQRIHRAALVLMATEGPATGDERIHRAAVELAGSGLISVQQATDFLTRLVVPSPMVRAFSSIDTWENLPPPVERDFRPEGPWKPGMPRLPTFLRHLNERHPDIGPQRGRCPLAKPTRKTRTWRHPRQS